MKSKNTRYLMKLKKIHNFTIDGINLLQSESYPGVINLLSEFIIRRKGTKIFSYSFSSKHVIKMKHVYNYAMPTHMKNNNEEGIEEIKIFLLIRTFTLYPIKTYYWSNSKMDTECSPSKII